MSQPPKALKILNFLKNNALVNLHNTPLKST